MSDSPPTVLITGCSSGFGRGMVDEFLARGWHVFATLRRAEERRERFAEALRCHPQRLELLELDVTDAPQRATALAAARAHGRLDCLVPNAGYGAFGALEDLSEAQLRHVFEVNFFGAALLIREALPMLREARGSLVVMSSAFGINGFPLTSAYCATKFALEGLTESLYYELHPHGVRVALVEPGANVTGFGESVTWGEFDSETYRGQTQGYRRLKAGIGARGTDNTPHIARLTADFAEGRRRQLRNVVGKDAWAGYLYRTLVPDRIANPLTRWMYGRIFRPKE